MLPPKGGGFRWRAGGMEGASAQVNRCSLFLFVFAPQVLLNGRGAGIPEGAASGRNSAELQCDSATPA